ncbi:hypothetical protein HNR60_001720 [Rhodopseudomonas rhenobacensis]|uniref:Uncharacterized protein n=1 Tax=Rhodopseudomonas rhenobacensis TaxID=87461 RepID=A0A7W8DZK8_9BRAD|nr:hypothetical protein [Rhodopseudomonas rhenobacensis]MBB5046971.1 hypothetical protein [Rhodopseudomonas rhenobacensis]
MGIEIVITRTTEDRTSRLATVNISDAGSIVMRSPGLKTITVGSPIDADQPLWRQIERMAARLARIEEIQ